MSTANLLARVPLFSLCSARELERIARLARPLMVPAGMTVVTEGDVARDFFVIQDGWASATSGGRHLGRLGPGDFFGELALLGKRTRTADVVAETDLSLFAIRADDFDAFLDISPGTTTRILKAISERLRRAEDAPAYAWSR